MSVFFRPIQSVVFFFTSRCLDLQVVYYLRSCGGAYVKLFFLAFNSVFFLLIEPKQTQVTSKIFDG